MKLSKFCDESLVVFNLKTTNKEKVIEELVNLAASSNMIKDPVQLLKDVKDRENLVTTGVGYGVAFPHAKTRSAKGIVIAFGRSDKGIDFDAMDHRPVHLFFLIAAPEDAIGAHLNVMARLSYLMKLGENREKLMKATSPGDVLALMDEIE
ncbi:MAG: PTS sugar transporter subunit IIA [candidate division Zixibacteria bacterium]|nr:PTS sugar transporter subunit IIA [candidate division Zixibacteria bacterium]MDD5425744.1 PTS sugar transporter subunit IIA [candidate division Zixibacteria bacterium]